MACFLIDLCWSGSKSILFRPKVVSVMLPTHRKFIRMLSIRPCKMELRQRHILAQFMPTHHSFLRGKQKLKVNGPSSGKVTLISTTYFRATGRPRCRSRTRQVKFLFQVKTIQARKPNVWSTPCKTWNHTRTLSSLLLHRDLHCHAQFLSWKVRISYTVLYCTQCIQWVLQLRELNFFRKRFK